VIKDSGFKSQIRLKFKMEIEKPFESISRSYF
jgi:hypothetical protein